MVRKQLMGLAVTNQSNTPIYQGIYSQAMTEQVYNQLQNIAQTILQAGFSVVVDATFIKQRHRQDFLKLAQIQAVPFKILHADTNETKILQWLAHRQQQANQISEAREDIYYALKSSLEKLTAEEIVNTICLDVSMQSQMEQTLQHFIKQLMT